MIKTKRLIPAALIIPICFLVYHFGKDIYQGGIKDGKANAAQHVTANTEK
jgi:hypothetical protein